MEKIRIISIGNGKTEAEVLRILDRKDILIVDIDDLRDDVMPEDMMIHKYPASWKTPVSAIKIPFYPPLTRAQKHRQQHRLNKSK